jgi:hypothetical protein
MVDEIWVFRALIRDFGADDQPDGLDFGTELKSINFIRIQIIFQNINRVNERITKKFEKEGIKRSDRERRGEGDVGRKSGTQERGQERG